LRESVDGGPAPDAERFARCWLRRWGIVLRELLARETCLPPWRVLLPALRRLEARGEIRGGRFVAGLVGEQFALPEAGEALRAVRRRAGGAGTGVGGAPRPLHPGGIPLAGGRPPPLGPGGGGFRGGAAAGGAGAGRGELGAVLSRLGRQARG